MTQRAENQAGYDLKASCTMKLGWNIWIFPHGEDHPIVEMGIPPDEVENYVALFGLCMDEVQQARFDTR